jgi:hypothetical protein
VPSRKGSPNKLGALAKDNIAAVFNRLGGTAAMADWAEANKTEFYRIYARLVPTQVTGEGGGPVKITVEWQQSSGS